MSGTLKRSLLLGAALAALLGAGACGRNSAGMLLAPTGTPPAVAGITGRLDFGTPAPYPSVLILVARVRGTARSTYASMELTGSFTSPQWSPGGAGNPKLAELAPKVWVDTLSLVTGHMEWKFVANASWSSAFCSVLSGSDVDGLAGNTKLDAGGGKNLTADVSAAQAGFCVCTMDENSDPPTYEIERVGEGAPAVYSSTDGSFTITGLAAGTYNILFRVPGQPPFTLADVVVGNSMTDVGTVSVTGAAYTIHTALAFDPYSLPITTPPYPPVTARLYSGTDLVDTLAVPTSESAFDMEVQHAGDYRLVLTSPLYTPVEVPVTVDAATVDLGTLNMEMDFNLLASAINVAGDFNGWSTSALPAEMGGDLAWSVTTTTPIAAGTHDLKFARYGSFVDQAYGGDPAATLSVPVLNHPTYLVTGGGSSTNAIRVSFPTTANYTFTLDERRQVFSIQAVTAAASSPRR